MMKLTCCLIVLITTTFFSDAALAQSKDCDQRILNAQNVERADIEKCKKRLSGYLSAFKSGNIEEMASFLNGKDRDAAAKHLRKRVQSGQILERSSNIESVCAETITIFYTNYFAVIGGTIDYLPSAGLSASEFFIYASEDGGEFYFTEVLFSGIAFITRLSMKM